jgi:membrane dipeptidase
LRMETSSPDPVAIDLHSDTLSRMRELRLPPEAFLEEGEAEGERPLQVDLSGARAAGLHALAVAVFMGPGSAPGVEGVPRASEVPLASEGLEMAALLGKIERASGGVVRQARTAGQILSGRSEGALSLLLSLENAGDVSNGSLEVLERYRDLGVKMAGLVWYARNPFGSGVGKRSDACGLSPLGIEAVRALGRWGIAVDVSHLNPAGVRDVLHTATGPVVATHSNALSLCPHPRNLDDDQIREIAARGGVIGLCLFPKFLRDTSGGNASVLDAVRHLERIAEVGGIGCIASGADFDGIHQTPEGIGGIRDLPRIAEALRGSGWSEGEVAAYRGGNAMRVLESLDS